MSLAQQIIQRNHRHVEAMIAAGADVNDLDEYGFTPLIETAIVNDIELAKLLLSHGAEVNHPDLTGSSALHWAVENSNLDFCRLLLERGADANAYSTGAQSVLVKSILRDQSELKELLCKHGANITFANDFINTKLLGHRYELQGQVDLVNAGGKFTEIDLEGFMFEFSIGLLAHSLIQYMNNFAAKKMQNHFPYLQAIVDALLAASELIKYQQYNTDRSLHEKRINELLRRDLVILPVAYEGHAITLIKKGNILVACDRRKKESALNGINFYRIDPNKFDLNLMKFLIYEKKDAGYIENTLPKLCKQKLLARLMIGPQRSGNCSWANVEACIPACMFLLTHDSASFPTGIFDATDKALVFYRQWQDWDLKRALHFCIADFYTANPARKASKAALLAAILFQRCYHRNPEDVALAHRIIPLLQAPGYEYILKNYKKIYLQNKRTKMGENLLGLVDACDDIV